MVFKSITYQQRTIHSKCISQKIVALESLLLCIPLFLLQIGYALGAETETSDAEVNAYVQQLNSRDEDVTVRISAASALGKSILGNPNFANPSSSAKVAIEALIKALNDGKAVIQITAAVAIGKRSYSPTTEEDISVLSQVAVPALINILKEDSQPAPVRASAANSIGEIFLASHQKIKDEQCSEGKKLVKFFKGKKIIEDAVQALKKALNDPNVQVRAKSAYALGVIGTDANSAVPTLIDLLNKKQNVVVRAKAADSLGNRCLKASLYKNAVPALIVADRKSVV